MNRMLSIIACVALGVAGAAAQDLALTTAAKPAPDAVAEEIRAALGENAFVLADGDEPVWEFWFRESIKLPYAPDEGQSILDVVKKTTLLGIVQLHSDQRDFKDNLIEKGIYTLRYAAQPQDGNHMGTATYNYFVILLPVSFDKTLDTTMDHDTMADESTASSVDEHPMNLNVQPVDSDSELPALGDGKDDTKLLNVELAAEADGATVPLRFGVVYKGKGHIQ